MKNEIVMTSEEIQATCKEIAAKLDDRFARDNVSVPIFVGVLKGAVNFFIDLLKNVKTTNKVDYIQASSYDGTSSTGKVTIKKDISTDIKGKTVVIVEDVVDTGITMKYLVEYFNEKYQPKEIIICSLFDKLYLRQTDLHVDYVGKVLKENKFLVGYGLDYNELHRNVPYVFVATKEDVSNWDKINEENK